MNRVEINVITKESRVVPMTEDEIADAIARTAYEKAAPKPVSIEEKLKSLEARLAALEKGA